MHIATTVIKVYLKIMKVIQTFSLLHTVVNSAEGGTYLIKEQGYAGFEIFLEVHFKGLPTNDPARKVKTMQK